MGRRGRLVRTSRPRRGTPDRPLEHPQRAWRTRPQFAEHPRGPRGSEEPAEHQRDHDQIVELADDRQEVGDEVDRREEVADRGRHQQLPPARDAPVPEQAFQQDDAIGDEAGQSASVGPAAGQHEKEHGNDVDGQDGDRGVNEPADSSTLLATRGAAPPASAYRRSRKRRKEPSVSRGGGYINQEATRRGLGR